VLDAAERELVEARLRDTGRRRLAEMDGCGIERAVLSLTSPGIQDELDREQAVARAVAANDALAEIVVAAPDRYAGLAALPLQDLERACAEVERAVRGLGLSGVLVNGYSSVGDNDGAAYYDGPAYDAFWELLVELDVPSTFIRAIRSPISGASTKAGRSCSARPGHLPSKPRLTLCS
jgi:predicted TIM-barrel fold metal-dependent hydrolase